MEEVLEILREQLKEEEKDSLYEAGEWEYGTCTFDSN